MNDDVKTLYKRAKKYGAPNKEALCLAISRMCCEQCKECDIRGGSCDGIWNHETWLNYSEYACNNYNKDRG